MRYVLDAVYRAAALDEIYRMITDEMDLTIEDLHSLELAYNDLRDPDLSLASTILADNLNITPAQDNIKERIEVLRAKVNMLRMFKSEIEDSQVIGFHLIGYLDQSDDNPF